MLKGAWLIEVLRSLLAAAPTDRPFLLTDGFAGQPDYELTPASRRRLARVQGTPYAALQESWASRGRLASSATVAAETVRAARGSEAILLVWDHDAERRERYRTAGPPFRVADASDGFDLLASEADLALVDPYAFLQGWEQALPRVVEAARTRPVLLYLFNKSLRGGKHLRNYTNFLYGLDQARPDGRYLLGRIPADSFQPQATHEMLYLPPEKGPASDGWRDLQPPLFRLTADLQVVVESERHWRGGSAQD